MQERATHICFGPCEWTLSQAELPLRAKREKHTLVHPSGLFSHQTGGFGVPTAFVEVAPVTLHR